MKTLLFFSFFICVVFCINNNPIIGILTQPGALPSGQSYIAASYVKFIESAGARVVPIFYSASQEELKAVFQSINGILLPGGGSDLNDTPLYKAGKYLYDLAIEANDNGDFFPIQGHCQGFEFLSMITSQNLSILTNVELENSSVPLVFYDTAVQSRLFGNAPQDIVSILKSEAVTLNNHHYGVTPSSFNGNRYLPSFYNILSWNMDSHQKVFISTMEAQKYPFYALQWHAEKPMFEWNTWEDINHSTDSVRAMQYIANFFVAEARKNNHHYPSQKDEMKALIYNYPVTYTGPLDGDFVQTYFFTEPKHKL